MTISTSALPHGILPPNSQIQAVDPKSGMWTTPGLQLLQQIQSSINGLSPTVTCNASFLTNKYTLTPVTPAPSVPSYCSYWSFAFVAPSTSTGLITATVVPDSGTLATLPVYKSNGSAQATTGDIVSDLFYLLYYVDSLNSGNGGFVLK